MMSDSTLDLTFTDETIDYHKVLLSNGLLLPPTKEEEEYFQALRKEIIETQSEAVQEKMPLLLRP